MAKTAFQNMTKLFSNKGMQMGVRLRLLKCYVWSILLYGCEAWTISKRMQEKLEATEMWFLRRMLRIPWADKITNVAVLRRAGTGRQLTKNILERQMKFLGHVMRKETLEELSVTGRIEGTRGRGRPRRDYLHSLCDIVGGITGPTELLRATKDRLGWKLMIADVRMDTAP